ncbi:hypothetical protein P154DRAFT_569079 [Amniculicola lignicola CBS 123094]|uniref:GPI anchored protein n=1 Tax=Amniculicola lignicola CBS 123094 TaxID=1392246 RepID=A0A6A5X0P9_9PLEO|nr:hypothetical protein P154DRAFT_569079 [Amniculicola lignicola CBS 123094]
MHFSAFIFPLTVALAAASEPLQARKPLPQGLVYAKQYRSEAHGLEARTDVSPTLACGSDYVDCNNGWCCSSGTTCAGTLYDIPVCDAPGTDQYPLPSGTAIATPFKNLEAVMSSLTKALAEATGDPSDDITTTGAGASSTESVSGVTGTGAAVAVGPATFGTTAVMVFGAWGVAALGGAGWFMMG